MAAAAASDTFDARSRALRDAALQHEHLTGLVLLGSAAESARGRRDEWSDHDFFAIVADGQGPALRPDLGWLPAQPDLAAVAREGEIGFVALYDDGHVFEFALAEIGELGGALAEDATVLLDDDGRLAGLIGAGRDRVRAQTASDPAEQVTLMLVKLLIGVGRARRGELLTAGEFVRTWAVQCFVRAVRSRHEQEPGASTVRIDPVRRFERDHPEVGARLAAALERPVEAAARALYELSREMLEPDWECFPSRAADAVANRLGWMPDRSGA